MTGTPLTPSEIADLRAWAGDWARDGTHMFHIVLRLIEERDAMILAAELRENTVRACVEANEKKRATILALSERVAMCSELLGRCAARNPELGSGLSGHFNENFIENFRSSLRYAGLLTGDIVEESTAVSRPKVAASEERKWPDPPAPLARVKVGDLVQWTFNGVEQFPEPRPVMGFHGSDRAFFEEGGGGIALISELTVMDTKAPPKPAQAPALDHTLIVEERFTLDEGPVTIRWPNKLSAESVHDFEHHVKGLIARARRKAGIKKDDAKDDQK